MQPLSFGAIPKAKADYLNLKLTLQSSYGSVEVGSPERLHVLFSDQCLFVR